MDDQARAVQEILSGIDGSEYDYLREEVPTPRPPRTRRWMSPLTLFDALRGYKVKVCECCGRKFSPRHEWLPGQVISTGPTSGRLAYCRRCMVLGLEVEEFRAQGRLLRAACERVGPDGVVGVAEISSVLDRQLVTLRPAGRGGAVIALKRP